MLFDLKSNPQRPVFHEFEQSVPRLRVPSQEIRGLDEHRLTNEQGHFEFVDAIVYPAVVLLGAVEKGD
jgi:hypothetical protein